MISPLLLIVPAAISIEPPVAVVGDDRTVEIWASGEGEPPRLWVQTGAVGSAAPEAGGWRWTWQLPAAEEPRRLAVLVIRDDDWEAATLEVARRAVFRVEGPPGAGVVVGEENDAHRVKLDADGHTAVSALVRPGQVVRAEVSDPARGYRRIEEFGVPDRLQVWGVATGQSPVLVRAVVFRDSSGWVDTAHVTLTAPTGTALTSLSSRGNGRYGGPLQVWEPQVRLVASEGPGPTAEVMLPQPEPDAQGETAITGEPWLVRLGVRSGVEVTTSGFVQPAVDAEARYAFWLAPQHALAVGVDVGVRWVELGEDGRNHSDRQSSWLMPLEATLYYVHSPAPGWGLEAGLGTGLLAQWYQRVSVNPGREDRESGFGAGWCFTAGVGATYALGPGMLMLQARVSPTLIAPDNSPWTGARFGAVLGYSGNL